MRKNNNLFATLLHLRIFATLFQKHITLNKYFGLNFDFAGATTAILCAVHCSVFPILLSCGLLATDSHSHVFDFIMLSLGLIFAGFSLVKDWYSIHRVAYPLITGVVGFVLLFIGIEMHGQLLGLNIIGGLLIAFAHYLNHKCLHAVSVKESINI